MTGHVPAALAVEDLVLPQGVTWSRGWEYGEGATPAAPAGWSTSGRWVARMQVRPRYGDPTVLLSAHSTDTTAQGVITLSTNGANGFAVVTLAFDALDLVGATWRTGVYDLELVDTAVTPNRVERLVEGAVALSPEVTTRA